MPIQVFDKSLNVPSTVRQWRMSKSPGGAGSGGAVSVSNRLRHRKSTRSDTRLTTAIGNGRRYQTRQRLIARKTAAITLSKKLATITALLAPAPSGAIEARHQYEWIALQALGGSSSCHGKRHD